MVVPSIILQRLLALLGYTLNITAGMNALFVTMPVTTMTAGLFSVFGFWWSAGR